MIIKLSLIVITIRSKRPPLYPASKPRIIAITREIKAAINPSNKVFFIATMAFQKISCPIAFVPRGYFKLEARSLGTVFQAFILYGENKDISAIMINKVKMEKPNLNLLS
jgi:hypothetical protein